MRLKLRLLSNSKVLKICPVGNPKVRVLLRFGVLRYCQTGWLGVRSLGRSLPLWSVPACYVHSPCFGSVFSWKKKRVLPHNQQTKASSLTPMPRSPVTASSFSEGWRCGPLIGPWCREQEGACRGRAPHRTLTTGPDRMATRAMAPPTDTD